MNFNIDLYSFCSSASITVKKFAAAVVITIDFCYFFAHLICQSTCHKKGWGGLNPLKVAKQRKNKRGEEKRVAETHSILFNILLPSGEVEKMLQSN